MIAFLIRLAISAATLMVMANVSNGAITVHDKWGVAFVAALLIGLLNALVKPILGFIAGALTFPLSCITLGLWSLILSWLLNGLMFYVASKVLNGFDVKNFWAAMIGALVLSVVNALASALLSDKKDKD
jgi:putative membrane protein